MKRNFLFTLVFSLLFSIQVMSQEKQLIIDIAVLAAPKSMREGAQVISIDSNFTVTIVRKGTNELICLTDNPNLDGINVTCYHNSLEPFMARGRELKKSGKKFKEIFDIREQEVKSGELVLPKETTLHALTGESYDAETKKVLNEYRRWVVYIPYATVESTGLPLKAPVPGAPWLMDPGTHRAHIMITPPRNK